MHTYTVLHIHCLQGLLTGPLQACVGGQVCADLHACIYVYNMLSTTTTNLNWNISKLILTMKETLFFDEIMRFLARKSPKKTMLTQFRWWHKVQQPGSPQRADQCILMCRSNL